MRRALKPAAAFALLVTASVRVDAQSAAALTAADSGLVGRVLLAEDRRDSSDLALTEAAAHSSERVRLLARRALGRIRDPRFAARDSFPALPTPRAWPEPAWRLRMRGLTAQRTDCAAVLQAMTDANAHVRLRAMDLAGTRAPTPGGNAAAPPADTPLPCAGDDAIASALRAAIDGMPADVSSRASGATSWHEAAHAIVALARLRPAEARERLPRLATHRTWQLRQYATRAAAALADTTQLRAFARDAHDNVRETAIESLSRIAGHGADDIYLEALQARGAPVVRVAAVALKGSSRADVVEAAMRAFERFALHANSSEHDTRAALLEAAGRTSAEDRPPPQAYALPADAVALALGADIRLRVTLASRSGGGSFVVRLRGDVAPMMGARVLQFVRQGWYHGLDWHRVESDFVIQGLGPASNEYVGHAQFLRDELGTVPHVAGTLGMSTRGHDTGDGQWFINLRDNLRLGRDYTVWAEIIEGFDVVNGVLEGDVVERITIVR
jgi:cyclophilin family peptidyl-prolyl cis-trans isomerase